MELSGEELITLDTYDSLGSTRNLTHADPLFWQAEIKQLSSYLPRGKLIDVGCGAGRDALVLGKNYDYYGFDLSSGMLNAAKQLCPARYAQMSMYDIAYTPGTFDGFWAAASLLHAPKSKVGVALNQILQATKKGAVGFVAMRPGRGEGLLETPQGPRFFALYTDQEFSEKLKDARFEIMGKSDREDFLTYFVRSNAHQR